jgi:hypothetical protein
LQVRPGFSLHTYPRRRGADAREDAEIKLRDAERPVRAQPFQGTFIRNHFALSIWARCSLSEKSM